jgi:hypothetical protein
MSAHLVTGKASAVITGYRCGVAKARHEWAAKEGAEAAKRRQEQLEQEVRAVSDMGVMWAADGQWWETTT